MLAQKMHIILGGAHFWVKNDERLFGHESKGYICIRATCTESLSRVAPLYHYHRQTGTERQINPHPYTAEYHGHKLHMDQNEKLAAYGVVHVCSMDGFSRHIPSFACMVTKKDVVIYKHVYR